MKWATRAAWWTWPTSSSRRESERDPQLRHRHGILLGVYAGRWRAADAGAAAFLPARLHAIHARVPVSALRDRRHRRQSRGRLAGVALWHPPHAGGRPDPADHRPVDAVHARPG